MIRRPIPRLVWILAFLVLTLLVVYAAFGYLYVRFQEQLETELGLRLMAVASGAASSVADETWTRLPGDATARERLRELRAQNNVSDIFLFDLDEVTVLDLGERYPEGELNLALAQDVEAGAYVQAGLPTAGRLYSDGGDYLKSAYAPVFGADGVVVGGVGVEASADFFQVLETVRRTLVVAALVVLAGMTLLGAGFVRLISARTRLETRLRRTETLATMGQMAAMLAHEVRNPLGIIRGAAERLGQRYEITEDELYRFIPEEVDRLERTMGAYLEFARPGGMGEVTDLRDALRRTLQLVGDELARKGISLEPEIEEEARVPVDAHRLQQAFLNLILNARDAMPEGGSLRVALSRRGRRVRVSFVDTGVGMSPEMVRQAQEPFVTSKETGSGLGLAVVRRMMDEARGEILIESTPGSGTAVRLEFPLDAG